MKSSKRFGRILKIKRKLFFFEGINKFIIKEILNERQTIKF